MHQEPKNSREEQRTLLFALLAGIPRIELHSVELHRLQNLPTPGEEEAILS